MSKASGPRNSAPPRSRSAPPARRDASPIYDDSFRDGPVAYRYYGDDPEHGDDAGLRRAMRDETPLACFLGIAPNRYLALWPVSVVANDPDALELRLRIREVTGEAFPLGDGERRPQRAFRFHETPGAVEPVAFAAHRFLNLPRARSASRRSIRFSGAERSARNDSRSRFAATTTGPNPTPFYRTGNERRVADEETDRYRLVRLYEFRAHPAAYRLRPPPEERVRLDATLCRAALTSPGADP